MSEQYPKNHSIPFISEEEPEKRGMSSPVYAAPPWMEWNQATPMQAVYAGPQYWNPSNEAPYGAPMPAAQVADPADSGKERTGKPFCTACGNPIREEDLFCTECGNRLKP